MIWVIIAVLAIIIGAIQELLPILGIAFVIFLIYGICMSISNKLKEKEANRVASVEREVSRLKEKYMPANLISVQPPIPFKAKSELLNREVIDSVYRFKNKLKKINSKCDDVDKRIKYILSCSGCASSDEQFAYLQRHDDELKQLSLHSQNLHKEIDSRKLQLLHEDKNKLFSLKKASLALLSSKKCISTNADVSTIFTEKTPLDLSIFQYESEPITMFIDSFFVCMFTNVILVFDCNGVFSSALDPTALQVVVDRKRTKYSYDKNIDTDSQAITYTEKRTRWLYACKDGSPDLRYNGNRQIEYPVEVNGYEYGNISIKIANSSISFTVSSSKALELYDAIPSIYCHACNTKHNPIPSLLNMLGTVSDDKSSVDYISDIYMAIAINNNYFCKEVIA